jgi:acetyl-CoA carboxylase carboxyltransferase component
MGGEQAANTLLQIEKPRLVGISAEDEKILLEKITKKYNDQTTAVHAAAHLWVDAIIDPLETRNWLSMGLEAANHAPIKPFSVGVIQT